MLDHIRQKLNCKEPVFGAAVSMLDASISEMLGFAGFDFLWIDMEHTALTKSHVLDHLVAASSGRTAGFVRVPWNDPVMVKPILDMGPDGVIFPMIRTAEDARLAVNACECPPKGVRGCGPRRAVRYGMDDYATYIRESSRLCWKILQIDHVDSVRNLGQIAQVPGVDCWMIGPNDLSVSLGLHGQSDAPEVQEVLDQIAEKATQWGVVLGAFVGDSPAAVRQWKARGVRLFTIGSDTGYLMSSARSSLRQVRETAQGKAWGVGASP